MRTELVNPNFDCEKLRHLSEQFTQHWKRLHAFYLDAVAGFEFVFDHVESEQERARNFVQGSELDSEEFQDTRMFSYANIFSETFCTSAIHRATQGEVKARNEPNGANFITLGQLCVVSFSDFWNDYLRAEYVIAKGHLSRDERNDNIRKEQLRKHGSHDLWGDLAYLRNSIVHKQGVASSKVAKCKIIKWFKPGDPISLTPDHMRAIFLALLIYRNELFSEQIPEQHIFL